MNRTESRKIIMTILYQVFLYQKNKISYDLNEIIKENAPIQNEFVNEVVHGVLEHQKEIDEKANYYLKDWNIERLGTPDGAILRMAIYELLYTNTPEIVCINEAVELAKEFSDDKVKNMINGVLDKIYHDK